MVRGSFIHGSWLFIRGSCLIQIWFVTDSDLIRDSFINSSWLSHIWLMTHSNMVRDSFKCMLRSHPISSASLNPRFLRDSFTRGSGLIHLWFVAYSNTVRDSFIHMLRNLRLWTLFSFCLSLLCRQCDLKHVYATLYFCVCVLVCARVYVCVYTHKHKNRHRHRHARMGIDTHA